jgi:hypothetical protein
LLQMRSATQICGRMWISLGVICADRARTGDIPRLAGALPKKKTAP